MERMFTKWLVGWKQSKNRKPLLIKGARQVGKTYVCLDFGKTYYDNYIYLHFEGSNGILSAIFEKDLHPQRIIKELSAYCKQSITPHKTLIIFDEIQSCEKALTSLKYFCEEAPEYHIIAAGSLLGLAINRGNYSFPVGKVDMITMYPFNFEEFLHATNNADLINIIKSHYATFSAMPEVYHQQALALYRIYLVVGGYPAVIKAYLDGHDFNNVVAEQANIANSYIADMAKYASHNETIKSIAVFNTLPAQLAKESTKFQYVKIKSSARAKDYELSLSWLKASSVVLENIKVTEGKLPLNIYEQSDAFKLYYSDVGLLCFKAGILAQDVIASNIYSDKARGLLAENYVAEQLITGGHRLNYWESNGTAEIDFVLRIDDSAVPIEVKSSDNVRAKSLVQFIKRYNPAYAIRVSAKNFGYENGIKSVPLYAVFCI
ncbi:MAG: AAA family ATPase [Bacillota bacterium]